MNFAKFFQNCMYRVILLPNSINFFPTELLCTDLVFCSSAFICSEFDLQHDVKFFDPDCMRKPGQYCHVPCFEVRIDRIDC